MTSQKPQIEFVDTTLREGFQSAIELFPQRTPPAQYAKTATDSLDVSYVEIYGPGVYYSAEDYELLVAVLGERLQLYCGVVDKFDPAKKPHIKVLQAPRLSLTVIDKSPSTIDKLRHILDQYPSATLRLGMECAGSTDKSVLFEFLQQLTQLERVDNVTLSDSNGTMTPEALRELIMSLPQPLTSTLGFHLHNDRGLAAANALAAIDASATIGQKKISFDYTFCGLGERYGLLSLQEVAAFGQQIIKGDSEAKIKEVGCLFTDEAQHFHCLPFMKKVVHVAASHFDANGDLRPEYRTSINNVSK